MFQPVPTSLVKVTIAYEVGGGGGKPTLRLGVFLHYREANVFRCRSHDKGVLTVVFVVQVPNSALHWIRYTEKIKRNGKWRLIAVTWGWGITDSNAGREVRQYQNLSTDSGCHCRVSVSHPTIKCLLHCVRSRCRH